MGMLHKSGFRKIDFLRHDLETEPSVAWMGPEASAEMFGNSWEFEGWSKEPVDDLPHSLVDATDWSALSDTTEKLIKIINDRYVAAELNFNRLTSKGTDSNLAQTEAFKAKTTMKLYMQEME